MALHTAFTERFAVEHPIALVPMGGSAVGHWPAAVSNRGGLGLVGGGRGDRQWLDRELAVVVEMTDGRGGWASCRGPSTRRSSGARSSTARTR
jgi:nitronate monooxygenase